MIRSNDIRFQKGRLPFFSSYEGGTEGRVPSGKNRPQPLLVKEGSLERHYLVYERI